MADAPTVHRPYDVLPMPAAGTPVPLRPAKTDVQSVASYADEDTSSLHAPDAVQLVEQVLELVASEAAALLAAENASDRLADLNVRTALASWDALRQPDEALRLLELAEGHPLALRLRAMAALDDPALLGRLAPDTGGAADAAVALATEIAEAWLWRHADPARAGELADRLLAGELPAPWRAHATELACLAHAAAGRWPRVIALRTAALGDDATPDEIAATAALVLDRGRDPAAALALCWARLAHFPGRDAGALGWLRCFDVALDAATALGDDRRFELLDRRAALIGELPGGALEALATLAAVAGELDSRRDAAEAAALWGELAGAPAAQLAGAFRRYADLRASWSAAAAGDPDSLATRLTAHRRLADTDCAEVAATHAWRALELAALAGDPGLGELARAVAEAAGSPAAERWLDAVELAAPGPAAIARFEGRGGLALRWAAAIAERADPDRAIALWQRAAAAPGALPTTRDHLARRSRGSGDEALSVAYQAWATAEPDPRCAAALWCARGIVDLSRGDFVEAEDALRRAAELAPDDPFCRAALAAVYRAGRRHEVLAQVLAELARALTSRDARAAAAREHAELLDEHLGDGAGARAALQRLLDERPDDVDAMLALARLCERDHAWPRAIELRRRAAELATTAARRAEIWSEIARGEELRGDREAALAALDRAHEAGHPDALREQARLHHEVGRLDRALGDRARRARGRSAAGAPHAAPEAPRPPADRARPRARGRGRGLPRRAQHRARSDRGAGRDRAAGPRARAVGRARPRVPRRAADRAQPGGPRRGARQDRRVARARRGPPPPARDRDHQRRQGAARRRARRALRAPARRPRRRDPDADPGPADAARRRPPARAGPAAARRQPVGRAGRSPWSASCRPSATRTPSARSRSCSSSATCARTG